MFRFTTEQRLTKKHDFNHVFVKANKVVLNNITVLFRPNNLSCPRLGFAISKRFVKKSVLRNKIRRIIKESFRHQRTISSYDLVFLVNKTCSKQNIESINLTLEKLWEKLK